MARDCKNPKVFRGTCYNCGGYGHPASECPSAKGAGKGAQPKGSMVNEIGEEREQESERQLGGIDFGGSLERPVFQLEKNTLRKVTPPPRKLPPTPHTVTPPPGLTLGDFGIRQGRVNRFGRLHSSVKLTNSYSAIQCCAKGDCERCVIDEEPDEQLCEVFHLEREVKQCRESEGE